MKALRYLASPLMFVWLTFASYFVLLGSLDFATLDVHHDILWLGIIVFSLSAVLLQPNIRHIRLDTKVANQLLLGVALSLFPISIYAFIVTGGELTALLDDRFAIPGYGVVYAVLFSASVVGTAVFATARSGWLKAQFVFNLVFSGFVFGGKGFIFPLFWGIALGFHLGTIKFNLWKLFFLVPVMAMGAFLAVVSRVESASEALLVLGIRILFQADSVSWVSQMALSDIQSFPISAGTFVLDIFTRLIGIRVNPLSVGSEIAYVVAGDDSGGGPNPTLPILAYLVNQGSFVLAVAFSVVTVVILWGTIRICRTFTPLSGPGSVIISTFAFFVPFAVIDIVLLLQLGFCLFVIGLLTWVVGLLKRLRWQSSMHNDHYSVASNVLISS